MMFSKSDLFSLLRLYASNKTLLKIYYSLYEKLIGEESEEQREQLHSRIAMREKFNLQLMLCIEENFIEKEDSFIEKASVFSFPFLTQLQSSFPELILPDTWEKCSEYEIKNLNNYYDTINSPGLPERISSLLIGQKQRVEAYLYSYV